MNNLKSLNDYRLKYHVTPVKTSSNEKVHSVSDSYGKNIVSVFYSFLMNHT
mgnify:CR=1 FL=1